MRRPAPRVLTRGLPSGSLPETSLVTGGLAPASVFEPVAHPAGRMSRWLIPNERCLACGFLQQRPQRPGRAVTLPFRGGPDIGLSRRCCPGDGLLRRQVRRIVERKSSLASGIQAVRCSARVGACIGSKCPPVPPVVRRAAFFLFSIGFLARRPFLVEPIGPLLRHRFRHVVDRRDLRSRMSSGAEQNDVCADRYPADFLAFRALPFRKLLVGGFAGSAGHRAGKVP